MNRFFSAINDFSHRFWGHRFFISWAQGGQPWVARSRLLLILMLLSLSLSGCIHYDVGLHFDSPTRGEIVQHLRVGERLRSLSDDTVQAWLDSLERRTRSLGGRVETRPNQERVVRIPFSNAVDLEAKFNQFFAVEAVEPRSTTATVMELPEIASQLTLRRNNLLLLERNHLSYDLDLRSLGVLSSEGSVLISPGALVEFAFSLETPWGARSLAKTTPATIEQQGQQLTWNLVPGELNHLEAVFWLPSPLGIGTVVIMLLVLGGQFVKSRLEPTQANSISTPESAAANNS